MARIESPAMLGVLGGGQLARFFVLAAQRLGYRAAVLDPDAGAPAHRVADLSIVAPHNNVPALEQLGAACAAVTAELESVPPSSLQRLAARCVVAPHADAIAVGQDRIRQKRFLHAIGLPTVPFFEVLAASDRVPQSAFPALLKTARNGYDGKGQRCLDAPEALPAAWRALGGVACVLEKRIALERELSVVLARARDGALATFPVTENRHRNGILELSAAPADIPPALAAKAAKHAAQIAHALEYVGVLAVEFFVAGGELFVNEFAPRPHNSGHYTLDACETSQFEQQVRALCGLPLGSTRLRSPAAMANVLGDAWRRGEPAWRRVVRAPGARLHLYGQAAPRPGRKMGHVTVLAHDPLIARRKAEAVLTSLEKGELA